jgi:type IV secretory pathway TraG/TraD family ATPase VirD4
MPVQYEMPSPNDINILQHINNNNLQIHMEVFADNQPCHCIMTYVLDIVSASIISHITDNQRQTFKRWKFVPWLKNTTEFSNHKRFQSSEHITVIYVAVKYTYSKQYALTDQLRYLPQNKQHVGNVQARNKSLHTHLFTSAFIYS